MLQSISVLTDTRSKYERGRDILAEISGTPADAPKANYAVLAPEIEVFLKEHLFAELFERDVLTYAERELATVAIIASLGKGVEPMLKGHMGIALNVGVTPDELRGVLAIIEKNIGRSEADNGKQVLNELLQSKGLTTKPETPIVAVENDVKKQKVTFHNRDIPAEEYRLAETGEFDISVSMLQKIARRYGIALDALCCGSCS